MQSLLSPAESNVIQSFLSSVDYPDAETTTLSASEWALYNAPPPSMYVGQDDPLREGEYSNERREALSKATKDLMSLDPNDWGSGSLGMDNQSQRYYNGRGELLDLYEQQEHERLLVHQQQVLQHQQQHRQQQQQQQQRHNSFSTSRDVFPFLHSKGQQQQQQQQQHQVYPHNMQVQNSSLHQAHSVSPLNTISTDLSSPVSPHSPFNFQQIHNSMPGPPNHHPPQVHIPSQQPLQSEGTTSTSVIRNKRMSASRSTPAVTTSSTRRPSIHASASSPSAPGSSNSPLISTNGKRQQSVIDGAPKRQRSSTSPPVHSAQQSQISAPPKQALLSPSQKKANHIQSEQKRRANIRRGYEALCETVPALREAIREEEEAEKNAALRGGNATQRKKSRGKKNSKDGNDDGGKDKLDGRAGPRSENVVLSKTIDHIQALLAERSALLARLHQARSSLPPGHPALSPLIPDPPWEREWKGGEGKLGDEDPDGGSEGDDDGDDGE
ncbi:hypothetical protein D9613_007481 [Agrocybe pediades]|uniref:BHLH domain-containing protein n=1 Tax=Agrocybe pediades TaxID=84607 RepID=A0A8H4VL08_9AGAR|nr:hypothetical protein D9613_007481 [Agrocybe pediades]